MLPGTINREPNFKTAKKSGSCIVMHRDYFQSPAFVEMANENLVLVKADFPRKKKNTGTLEQVKRNEELAKIYNKKGSFPVTLLLDPDGKVIKTWQGNRKALQKNGLQK